MTTTNELKFATKRPRKASGKPKSAVADEQHNAAVCAQADRGPNKTTSKTALVLDMLQRPETPQNCALLKAKVARRGKTVPLSDCMVRHAE